MLPAHRRRIRLHRRHARLRRKPPPTTPQSVHTIHSLGTRASVQLRCCLGRGSVSTASVQPRSASVQSRTHPPRTPLAIPLAPSRSVSARQNRQHGQRAVPPPPSPLPPPQCDTNHCVAPTHGAHRCPDRPPVGRASRDGPDRTGSDRIGSDWIVNTSRQTPPRSAPVSPAAAAASSARSTSAASGVARSSTRRMSVRSPADRPIGSIDRLMH